jgi:hypothetical protein
MNRQHSAELGNEDALLNDCLSEADLDDTSGASDVMRLSRIEDMSLSHSAKRIHGKLASEPSMAD